MIEGSLPAARVPRALPGCGPGPLALVRSSLAGALVPQSYKQLVSCRGCWDLKYSLCNSIAAESWRERSGQGVVGSALRWPQVFVGFAFTSPSSVFLKRVGFPRLRLLPAEFCTRSAELVAPQPRTLPQAGLFRILTRWPSRAWFGVQIWDRYSATSESQALAPARGIVLSLCFLSSCIWW